MTQVPVNGTDGVVIAEVDMGSSDTSGSTVRATVIQASTIFYDTPATLDLGDISRAKFDFDVVGHYARPEVLSLIVRDDPATPVTFTSEKTEASHK